MGMGACSRTEPLAGEGNVPRGTVSRETAGSTPLDLAAIVRAAVPLSVPVEPPSPIAQGAVVAIGAFDGVHLGHRMLIAAAVEEANRLGVASVVVTFDPDPSELFDEQQREHQLLSVSDRAALCASLGVDYVLVLPFTRELAALEPVAFVRFLTERLGHIVSMHVGENFHFGHAGRGTVDTLRGLGERAGFDVESHELLECEGIPVSSTRIRTLLAQGAVADSARLLGRPHFVRGHVSHGRGEGTSFGFPTANVCCDARCCLPAAGVYACIVTDGVHAWPSAANVGAPPTFSAQRDAFLEANLLGFSGNLYDRDLAVVFLEWLRASRTFSSLEELERVVLGNIDWVRTHVGDAGLEVAP